MGALWGGRFREKMADAMGPLNRSLGVDYRLWRHDIRASKAWVQALTMAGVLVEAEGERLLAGLDRVAERLEAQDHSDAPDEDVHSLVERLLGEEVGAVAGKLHTGRSRNDQVATDVRLWGMEEAKCLEAEVDTVLQAQLTLAETSLDVILPGYTHLQQAQPIRAAHWVLSHFWPLLRDRERLRGVGMAAGTLPLGSGALAGCPFSIDREWLAEELGFRGPSENSLDAVSDRDWMAELAFTGGLLGVHLSRLGEDLVLFSSREFGYLALPEAFCTGSSLMPQKRNPDAAELIRGKSGRLSGNLMGFLTLLKGLPTGYNRDLQEDKELLFDTVDTLHQVLPVVAGVLAGTRLNTLDPGVDPGLFATDVADYLVRKGVPFRESHEVLGRLVQVAEEQGTGLSALPLEFFQEVHPEFQEDVFQCFSLEASVEARATRGGTARTAVEEQIRRAREALSG